MKYTHMRITFEYIGYYSAVLPLANIGKFSISKVFKFCSLCSRMSQTEVRETSIFHRIYSKIGKYFREIFSYFQAKHNKGYGSNTKF